MLRSSLCVVLLSVVAGACATSKTAVPYGRVITPNPAPVAQGLLADAVIAATEQLDRQLPASFDKKRVCVEVTGVKPMGHEDLRAYIRTRVEARLARRGGIVVPCCRAVGAYLEGSEEKIRLVCYENLDYRATVALDRGGIDHTIERSADVGLLLSQLALGTVAPAALQGLMLIDGDLALLTLPSAGAMVLGSIIWAIAKPPVERRVVLDAQVRLTVNLLPQNETATFATANGDGRKQLTIESGRDALYYLDD